uniref:Odorant binding protein 32 n=1 Tax=Holotrichia parallela TaxID=93412 RepID=A0A0S2UXG6_HOLPA|nr:odorant binding protein 32 [Holotrichia parallela]
MRSIILCVFVAMFMKGDCFSDIYAHECLEELGLDESVLGDLRESNITELTHDAKCLTACYGRKSGLVKDGKLIETVVLKELPAGVSVDLEKCQVATHDDECENFYKMLKCIDQQLVQLI